LGLGWGGLLVLRGTGVLSNALAKNKPLFVDNHHHPLVYMSLLEFLIKIFDIRDWDITSFIIMKNGCLDPNAINQ
jgi:hypothetical protein